MCSLHGFPPVAPEGQISLCEVEGRVHTASYDSSHLRSLTSSVAKHPVISITHELLHPSTSREDGRPVFIQVDEPLLERFFNTCLEQGLVSGLHLVSQSESAHSLLRLAASCVVKLGETITHIHNSFYPQLRESGPELVSAVSTTRDWLHSPIRYIAWHPHCTKLAVAALDDSIRVFCSEAVNIPILKRKEQRDISCITWRPFSASELAVGCEVGIFVWQVDPNSVVSRPSIGCSTLLKRMRHSPVTSLAWSPQGDLLLSASAADTTMYLWDISMESAAPLKRMRGGGVALVSWSPDIFKVFAATSGIVFRVWDTKLWTPDRWSVMSGHVQAACWSPCGSVVLFCTSEEPVVYSLTFKQVDAVFQVPSDDAASTAMPVIDLTQIELGEEGESVGGCVVSMVWDNKGRHLAITFRNSNLVAVFRTDLQTIFQVSPCCFVKGISGEVPNVISFQKNFNEGAVLTIGRGLLQRSFSADRSAGFRWGSITQAARGENNAERVEEAKRPARSSSWLSLWKKDDPLASEEEVGRAKVVAEEATVTDTSLVCTIPVTPVGASRHIRNATGGAVEKMFEMQEKHLHPMQAQQCNSSLGENSKKLAEAEFKAIDTKDFSHEPCEFPLTPRQISFIKRLQHTSICSMDALKTVEPPKQLYTRYKKMDLDERADIPSTPVLHPVAVYNSLKKFFNSNTICLTDSQMNMGMNARRFYSKLIMDPSNSNNAAMECKHKKSKKGKGKGKPQCVKIPSGIEGAQSSSADCQKYRMPGCKTPASTSCEPKPKKRAPCVKLEAPMPSYSECVKDPTPPARPTECPSHDKGPPLECLEEKTGISIDGCNPPKPDVPHCIANERKKPPKTKSKSCTDNKTVCDDVKPYKEAGAGLSRQPVQLPGRFTAARVTEPMNVQHQTNVPVRNFSNCKTDPPYNNAAMECKHKKSKKGKGKAKPQCVKIPSGIEGAQSSSADCQKYRMPGCKTPASTSCEPKPKKRAPCVKLEAPMPSYSECVKDPTPPARPTECPSHDKGPPLECLEEKTGISIDGCNPPRQDVPHCIAKERKTPPKKKSKSCTDNKTVCDDVKPYKEAGAGLSKLPKKCPSASTLTGVSETTIVMKQLLLPKRSFSYSKLDPPAAKWNFLGCSSKKGNCAKDTEEAKKPCFVEGKVKKSKKAAKDEHSPVSCTMKSERKSKCDDPTTLRPWKVCEKPRALFTHSCPKPPKKAPAKKQKPVAPCDTPMPTFKVCPKPKRKAEHRCADAGPPKPPPPPPPPPPTPKRCLCDDDPKDLPPDTVCKKVKNAKQPRKDCKVSDKDCSMKGGKKPECSKCHRENIK